ncbi:VWA domain-containing protein [Natronococcus sp. JC468]|uniref:VWA domain-containing protein n=1 Tax=Natronococcus sp. JC468 TaxID=1961921 RepID=UPI00143AD764|nr:VWA domain-containing protein [Natronococcus sp. JC468]NKE35248.1 VWA domain-containing protein [Natronococcus sp. JC468]
MFANAGGKKLSSTPFPAIVGQSELKRVLLAVAANGALDGALIVGEKGTAKSTAVRGLADLLPEQRAVADCRYGCAPDEPSLQCADCRERDPNELPVETRPVPLVTLPLGATRDRIVGTLSVEDALAGEAEFDPGLLARAHRGILYVDEVNLLDDHLVDVVLDAAASGINTVERDGVSVSHPASFTLIGTMNPEEGDLRPQLRDRFALRATVEGCRDIADRVEIIDRAIEHDADPGPAEADAAVERLGETVAGARDRLPRVELPAEFKAEIAELCLEAGVDGHRGDIATARTARTLAALEGRTTVIESDVREAVTYALPHRLRSTPFEDEPELEDLLEDRFGEELSDGTEPDDEGDDSADDRESNGEADEGDRESNHGDDADGGRDRDEPTESADGADRPGAESEPGNAEREQEPSRDGNSTPTGAEHADADDDGDPDGGDEDGPKPDESSGSNESGDDTARPLVPGQRRAEIGDASAPTLEPSEAGADDPARMGGARASTAPDADNRGARVRTESASGDDPVDAAASVRAAAARGASNVDSEDLRRSVRVGDATTTIVFAVDASASMRPAMRTAKGVVLELLRDSYQQRDEVAFVAFAGEDADVLLPPTDSVSLAARHLKELPSGDRTPLPAGLETARRVVERSDTETTVVVLVTDGRANAAGGSPTDETRDAARRLARTGAELLVVDADDGSRAGLSTLVADETGGERVPLSSLSAELVRSGSDPESVE